MVSDESLREQGKGARGGRGAIGEGGCAQRDLGRVSLLLFLPAC